MKCFDNFNKPEKGLGDQMKISIMNMDLFGMRHFKDINLYRSIQKELNELRKKATDEKEMFIINEILEKWHRLNENKQKFSCLSIKYTINDHMDIFIKIEFHEKDEDKNQI